MLVGYTVRFAVRQVEQLVDILEGDDLLIHRQTFQIILLRLYDPMVDRGAYQPDSDMDACQQLPRYAN